ncbi:hypothetical protein C8Q74DRAFT_983411 [Fomes fomentarius]|nr:hypothetical protein C8Q74DRAFT_983411 [Fomes fomentarius]
MKPVPASAFFCWFRHISRLCASLGRSKPLQPPALFSLQPVTRSPDSDSADIVSPVAMSLVYNVVIEVVLVVVVLCIVLCIYWWRRRTAQESQSKIPSIWTPAKDDAPVYTPTTWRVSSPYRSCRVTPDPLITMGPHTPLRPIPMRKSQTYPLHLCLLLFVHEQPHILIHPSLPNVQASQADLLRQTQNSSPSLFTNRSSPRARLSHAETTPRLPI